MIARIFYEDGTRTDLDGGLTLGVEQSTCAGAFRCRWNLDTPDGYFGLLVEDLPWPWWPHNQYVLAAIVNDGDKDLDEKRVAGMERRLRTFMRDTRVAMVPDKGLPRIDLLRACNSEPCIDEEAMQGTIQITPIVELQ